MKRVAHLGLALVAAACADVSMQEDEAASLVLAIGGTAKTTANLNLRRGPGTSFSVIDVMPAGSEVTIKTAEAPPWFSVDYRGTVGFASGRYLEAVLETPPNTGIWSPRPGTSWQWQLTGTIDTSLDVAMYDVDLFETPESTIDRLHANGRIVICYFSAGSYEPNRSDSSAIPRAAIGRVMDGWPDERWLDVTSAGVRDVMRARLDLARAKHCDGVEPDNVDGYANATGFALTARDQLDYNRFLAREAHARGLSIGLKNDLDQVATLVSDFDWALNEECFQYSECDALAPFVDAGKAVFQVEYGGSSLARRICSAANARQFDTLIKNLDLDAFRIACR